MAGLLKASPSTEGDKSFVAPFTSMLFANGMSCGSVVCNALEQGFDWLHYDKIVVYFSLSG